MVRCAFFLILGLCVTSCATLVRGTKQVVSIITHPAGAFVSNGTITAKTPATIELERGKDHELTISKPGYETQVVRVTRKNDVNVAQVILPGGLIGLGIDAATGAQYNLCPSKVALALRPEPLWKSLLKLDFWQRKSGSNKNDQSVDKS